MITNEQIWLIGVAGIVSLPITILLMLLYTKRELRTEVGHKKRDVTKESYKLLLIIWLIVAVLLTFPVASIWIFPIKIHEIQSILTISNGMVSAVSLIVGFTGTIITLLMREKRFSLKALAEKSTHAYLGAAHILTLVGLSLPVALFFNGYMTLIQNEDYLTSIRQFSTGLALSVFLLISTLLLVIADTIEEETRSPAPEETTNDMEKRKVSGQPDPANIVTGLRRGSIQTVRG